MIALDGGARAVGLAERRAIESFSTVLDALVGELPALRTPMRGDGDGASGPGASTGVHAAASGPVARRMIDAVSPWVGSRRFVTPMAAVAGSVADHVLAATIAASDPAHGNATNGDSTDGLRRAAVNNGGDIASWLAPGERHRIGVCADPRTGTCVAELDIGCADRIGGIATSGRHGRSLSFGIADAVTVLARDAASADVAATLIAGAVDLPGSLLVERVPANELDADTDLGDRFVTVDVPSLRRSDRVAALERALPLARQGIERGWLVAAFLVLQGELRTVGGMHRCESDAIAR